MKTRTKLLTAVLSTVTALSCALTAAAAGGPTIALKGNETTPAAAEAGSVTLTLKATEFSSVAGADLEITLNDGITLTGITVTNAGNTTWAPALNENYAVKNNKLKIVDIFNMGTENNPSLDLSVKLDFNDANIGRYEFTNNIRLVDEDEQDITTSSVAFGKLVIGKKTATAQTAVTAPSGAFVPYGSVVFEDSTYAEKDGTGAFTGVSKAKTANVTSFILPDENEDVTTFGASKGTVNDGKDAIQFGSYVDNVKAGDTFGTLIIAPTETGSFADVIDYYKNNTKYKTEEAILGRLMQILTNGNAAVNTLHTIKYNNKTKAIKVAIIPQNNYMWRDSEATKLQYAVRLLIGTDTTTEYTAIGYSVNNNTYNFSTEIKSANFSGLN